MMKIVLCVMALALVVSASPVSKFQKRGQGAAVGAEFKALAGLYLTDNLPDPKPNKKCFGVIEAMQRYRDGGKGEGCDELANICSACQKCKGKFESYHGDKQYGSDNDCVCIDKSDRYISGNNQEGFAASNEIFLGNGDDCLIIAKRAFLTADQEYYGEGGDDCFVIGGGVTDGNSLSVNGNDGDDVIVKLTDGREHAAMQGADGGNGDDCIVIDDRIRTANGNGGNDVIAQFSNGYIINANGGYGNDILIADGGPETENGEDTGRDIMNGDEGKDVIRLRGAKILDISGGDGADDIAVLSDGRVKGTLNGGAGWDQIVIQDGFASAISGGDGNDDIFFVGEANVFSVDGNSGGDKCKFIGSTAENLGQRPNLVSRCEIAFGSNNPLE